MKGRKAVNIGSEVEEMFFLQYVCAHTDTDFVNINSF
jgi:hypothetical protein